MPKQIRVRRERPSALSWAVALAVTMLAVYLITLSAPAKKETQETSAAGRVTTEITLAGLTVHFADLGCYPDKTRARMAAAAYVGRGAAGVVYSDGEGAHVLGAGYAVQADAERIAVQLSGQEGIEADVLSLSAADVAMRVTAGEEDADAIVQADRVLREQMELAASMALQVDRGEISASSARMLAAVSKSEAAAAARTLAAVRGAAEHPVCAGLVKLLSRMTDGFDAAAHETSSAAALSGRLRCCHAEAATGLIAYLNDLCG